MTRLAWTTWLKMCGVIDAQRCSMERRRGGGVQIISTYFRARHEVRIRY